MVAAGETRTAEVGPDELVTAVWAPLDPDAKPVTESVNEPTRDELVERLTRAQGNVAKVARDFGRARRQVYRWLERFDIDPASFR